MAIIERLTSAPERGPFATPRPDMRGRYLIRSRWKARAFAAMDAALRLVPVSRPAAPRHVDRLLVANWAHLGDVVTTLGAVRLLRERFPHARLGMLVGSWGLAAAEASGLVDTFHIVDHWSLNRSGATRRGKLARYLATRAVATREIAAAGYQVGIDFYPFFPPAHPLFRSAAIPVRVGFDSGGWGSLLTHRVRWPDRDAPIAEHYAALIEAAWPDRPVEPGSLRPRADRARLPPLPDGLAAPGGAAGYLVLHPGTGADTRDWGVQHWIDLIARLRADPDLADRRIVVTGAGARDGALARRLEDSAQGIVNMANQVDWQGFLAILAAADLVVCPDTVTSHLAAMLDTPLVCIFTGIVKPRQWGPYSDRATLLVQSVVCAPCNRWGCEAMACIRQTDAGDVVRAIRETLRRDTARVSLPG